MFLKNQKYEFAGNKTTNQNMDKMKVDFKNDPTRVLALCVLADVFYLWFVWGDGFVFL